MKRITSLLLAVTMMAALAVTPTLAKEVNVGKQIPKAVKQLAEELAYESKVAIASRDGDAAVTVGGSSGSAQPAGEKGPVLQFGEIRKRLLSYNTTARMLSAQEDELADLDPAAMRAGVTQMKTLQSTLNGLLQQVQAAGAMAPMEMQLIYGSLTALLQSNVATLNTQIPSMESQISSMEISKETGANSINDGINQLVKGVETLYIGIITMESALDDIQRGIDTLDRAVAILEKQQELGMASSYDVESIRHKRSGVVSQLESLRFQLKTSKITLESMCGYELKGTIQLAPLTMPTAEELAAVSYEKTVTTAMDRNVAVMNAYYEWWNDTTGSDSKRLSMEAAEDEFDYAYMIVCMTVGEKERLVAAAKDTVEFQQRTFEIEAKKYELGMISYEEYMTAKNNLEQARSDLDSARLELFTAYRNYIWGKDYGIV